ncbi:TPA: YebC/PmpR family DNA-binding transcriptional regulator [Candidatus Saccharibacteria bacterium]|nr:YebC/PmpR family DNA-binding transcriptional regulator [Candidatus Saccharibacteria bacterium]HRK40776.1 YebC/PmpR family DNA-binding transcriptional regulator [Candidatus Saccharibacteria bacterium]
MSGHSKWATIKRAKGANDAKRGAIFTKIGNQIAIAARSGTDPAMNPSLAGVIDKAKAANMPMSNIQRAIDRVKDKNAAQLEEVMYEGYGPNGIAILVEAATDNKNRTYPEVRHAFSKNGGNVAEPGSVAFQFVRKGQITISIAGDADEALLTALDAGAEDAQEADGKLFVYTDPKELHAVRAKLGDHALAIEAAELIYEAQNTINVSDTETAKKIMKLMDALDELDDVVATHANFDIDEGVELE